MRSLAVSQHRRTQEGIVFPEKKILSLEEIESQTALELPDREMMALVTVVIAGVKVDVDADVAANVCAQVLSNHDALDCRAIAQ